MSSVARGQTNPVVLDATGYTPYAMKRAETAAKKTSGDAKARRAAAALRDYWIKEHFIEGIENYLQQHEKDLFRSQWECKADKKGLYSRVKWEMDKINDERQIHLSERRKRLKKFLGKEQEMYFAEEKGNEQSPAEKKADMLERYKNIMVQKEMEREVVVKLKKDQQFRMNCDELRSKTSKKICELNAFEGKILAEQKHKLMKEKEQEDKMFSQAWIQDVEAKTKRQLEEESRRKARDMEYGKYVKDQMRGINIPKYDTPSKKDEREIMDELQRLMDLENEWERAQKKTQQERMKHDLDKCLKSKLKRRAREVQEDLMLDLYFLDQIIHSDIEKQREKEKKRALRKEQEEYLAYLREQIKKEAEYEKLVEKLQQEESDKMWEKREKEWEADRRMRDALNKQAIEECREQIRNTMEKCHQVEKMKIQYDKEVMKQAELDRKEILENQKAVREKNYENQRELLDQIKDKKLQAKETKMQEEKEIEKIKEAQKEYDRKIDEAISNLYIDNIHPFRLKTKGYGSLRTS